ncbi:restriction endonuclease subunit S [Leuconostoc falkenbergense]|uniref:restriction endonuclease subunit S n=1 Tax=Leuconostoc falkenbergense TaxID=2766470 RepID=UPI0039EA4895
MQTKKRKSPSLRFRGYTDDWEERKLGELASFSKGNGYTKNDLVEFGDPIILYGRLYTKYETVIEKVDTFVNKKDNSIISEGSEVIVPASGESSEDISRASVVGKSGLILGGDLNIIKPVNYIDSIFLALTISNGSQQKEMSKRAQGKSVVHLHNSDLKQVNLLYPKLEEQQKIGSFFKKLDNTIALHQRKLDLLKEQKKGFLQKMFPKNGAKVPELRFAGFTDDWEERKLGDFLKTPEKVKAHIQSKDDLMTLKLNLGGLESGSNRETLELGSTIYYKRKAGQFIYGKQNFFNGSMAIIPIDLDGKATSGDVPSLDVVGILSEYLYVYVSRGDYWKSKESEASGTGSKRIHEKTLQGFDIKVPSTQNEQRKIGSFFKQLDNTIALHQRKLDLLKEQKKGLLQKMFV